MPKRLTIHLIRHGESEANLDKSVNERVADHRVALSPEGHLQAQQAGMVIARCLTADETPPEQLRVYASPYLRTRQTWAGVKQG